MKVHGAFSDDARGIIKAAQQAISEATLDVVQALKKETQAQGMTWDQIEYLLNEMKKKEPQVIQMSDTDGQIEN